MGQKEGRVLKVVVLSELEEKEGMKRARAMPKTRIFRVRKDNHSNSRRIFKGKPKRRPEGDCARSGLLFLMKGT